MNKEIVINNLENAVYERLKIEAEKHETDVLTIIVRLIKKSLGLESSSDADIIELAGTWSEKEMGSIIANN